MATTVREDYTNAVVGVIRFVSDDAVALVECDDPFVHYTVPVKVTNEDYAKMCVDLHVCVHEGVVHRLPNLDSDPIF